MSLPIINENIEEIIRDDEVAKRVRGVYTKFPFPNRNEDGRKMMCGYFKQFLMDLDCNPEGLKGKKVLDAGCGTGEFGLFLAKEFEANVTLMDISEASLKIARERAEREGVSDRVRFIHDSVLKSDFNGDKFDFVYSYDVLHHTQSARKGFKNISKALKKDAKIAIKVNWFFTYFSNMIGWKISLLHLLCPADDERRVRLAEKWFAKDSMQIHGLSRETYLYDNYAIHHRTHHTFGEILRWFKENSILYLKSYPPMELDKYIESIIQPNRRDSKIAYTAILRYALRSLPFYRIGLFRKNSLCSRAIVQMFHGIFLRSGGIAVSGIKQ